MTEATRIKRWIYTTLANDSAVASLIGTRVYSRPSPGAVFPLVEFGMQSGRDINGLGGLRLMAQPLFRIKAIAHGSVNANFIALLDRIDEIFQNARSVIFEGFVFSSVRNGEIDYIEPGADPNDYFTHTGGFYRINCYKV